MKKNKEIPYEEYEMSYEGTSTMALRKRNHTIAGNRELAIERLTNAAKAIIGGEGSIKPFIVAVSQGKPKCIALEKGPDGHYILPQIKVSNNDLKKKRRVVDEIMKKITPVLKSDIDKITFIALMRKDEKHLEWALKTLKETKAKPKLVNRLGCIFVEIGDEEFQI